jgi:hypothetical protein
MTCSSTPQPTPSSSESCPPPHGPSPTISESPRPIQSEVLQWLISEKKSVNLSLMDFDADNSNWFSAKKILNQTLKGREIVQYTENNVKTDSNLPLTLAYLIRKNDCETMVKAYVNDAGQFLDLANKENVRILAGKTLI